ncbi:MAG: PP2C family serine/threonine-protein phosphatase [Betaproteobacteria bacterium]
MLPTAATVPPAFRIAGATVRGVSHVALGRPNQDALAVWPKGSEPVPVAIVAIADGHGGARHCRSETGSLIAVDATVKILREMVAPLDDASPDERSQRAAVDIPTRIVTAWNAAARAHLAHSPISDLEWRAIESAEGSAALDAVRSDPLLAYGATLLAVMATAHCTVILQLGDGDVLAVTADGSTTRPIPVDERLNGNLTTSICRVGAESDFRTVALSTPEAQPALLLLATDGYANSFKSDADFLQVGRDFLDMVTKDGLAAVEAQLPGILDHASQNGSGDDISLGLLQRVGPMPAAQPQRAPAREVPATARTSREISPVNQRMDEAEQRVGSLRRTAVIACLVALVAVGWSLRPHWANWISSDAIEPETIVGGTRKPASASPKPPHEVERAGDSIKAPKFANPARESEPLVAGGSTAFPSNIDDVVANHVERGVMVTARIVFAGPEPAACTVEATIWDGSGMKLGAASARVPRVHEFVPAIVPVHLLVTSADAAHAKALKNPNAAMSITLACDGHHVATSERQRVGE